MMREAFGTRKRFLGVPKVSFAGWVGTILHSTMAEESRIEALVLWLDGGNWERKKYMAHKNTHHVVHWNFCLYSMTMLTKILENGHVKDDRSTERTKTSDVKTHKSRKGFAVQVIMTNYFRQRKKMQVFMMFSSKYELCSS